MIGWYLVRTKVRQELVARENLVRQRFESYLPTIRANRRRGNRWRDVVEPLFPGYLFVQLDFRQQNVASVRSTRGVVGLVRFGAEPLAVPDKVVNALIDAHGGDPQAPVEPTELFKEGEPVCFVDGPLAGMQAIFRGRTGADRVAVLLSLLGRVEEVAVSPHAIVPLR